MVLPKNGTAKWYSPEAFRFLNTQALGGSLNSYLVMQFLSYCEGPLAITEPFQVEIEQLLRYRHFSAVL